MIGREKIMVVASGNIMRKTPQEAYDLIENMTLHHFQWDVEVYYDTSTGPGHPHTIYYSNFDESDEDEPSEVEKSKINSLIRVPSDAFLIRDKEIKFNPLKDIDDPVPILRVYEKPLDSLDCISDTFDTTINNPLFDFDSEFTLNYENPIFDIRYEDSDESETETIMDEAHIHNSHNASQIPPLDVYLESEPEPAEYFIVEAYEKLITSGGKATFDMIMPSQFLTLSQFRYGLIRVGHISGRDIRTWNDIAQAFIFYFIICSGQIDSRDHVVFLGC
ncbi:hypothetical protein Tco_0104985 [Tanacetum coccineum]